MSERRLVLLILAWATVPSVADELRGYLRRSVARIIRGRILGAVTIG